MRIDRPIAISSPSSSADVVDYHGPSLRLHPEMLRRQAALLSACRRLPARPLSLSEAIIVGASSSQPKVRPDLPPLRTCRPCGPAAPADLPPLRPSVAGATGSSPLPTALPMR